MIDALWSVWWLWLAAALVLGVVEMLLPGFIFLGFAIGAAVTGLLLLIVTPSLPLLLLIFAALSLAAWLLLRHRFSLPSGQVKTFKDDING
ncbi:hypothetical protein KBY24_00500 [Ruegeria pomeroyi]|uniref:Uncharacterized protein n=2 Tax=Ruegeria TaxID=97050 RepID=A0A9Q3WIB8_9RHOB|nr:MULTISPECIES: hypothetical protein [Ruegeria]MCE8513747.1 hypothetical protein [Ruegeria pomeroyi]MCE8518667.1 hypothetical protein [Ruegeria pomeroyi]MCE8519455.1 hypothetical protein [Ruegeria pomeroyi]MCE8524412.1 hypothetical protein [Ruegeria pomeroyi]MCE8528316.1 hypothetical protein [Ruegeria pomeroyi]